MSWCRLGVLILAFVCIGSLLLGACATPESSRHAVAAKPPRAEDAQPDNRPRHRLQVRELVIPQADFNRYPGLVEARVGEGLSQLLVNALAETNRFDLSVAPDELAQHLSRTWASGPTGLKMHAAPSEAHTSKGFQLSVKLFDINACQPVYRRASAGQQASCRSSVGAQVRIEAPSGQFMPGATHPLSPQGRYIHPDHLPILGTADVTFRQSAVGLAAAKAIQYALLQALERLDRQGW